MGYIFSQEKGGPKGPILVGPGLVGMLVSAARVQAMYKHKAVTSQISIHMNAFLSSGEDHTLSCAAREACRLPPGMEIHKSYRPGYCQPSLFRLKTVETTYEERSVR